MFPFRTMAKFPSTLKLSPSNWYRMISLEGTGLASTQMPDPDSRV